MATAALDVLMASDTLPPLRQIIRPIRRGAVAFMPSAKSDARWRDALVLTAGLWMFVVLTALPYIIVRHSGQSWSGDTFFSVFLDVSSVFVSVFLALMIFLVFRATIEWPDSLRALILSAGAILASVAQAAFDILFTAWMARNVSTAWYSLPHDLAGGYEKAFKYLLVFGINLAFFQLAFVHRRTLTNARQLTDARTAAQHAQLEALRYQLNPHFLFNTLNSISALIVTRRNEDAEQMTNKLSTFLRSSLTSDPGGLVPLDDELALIEEYLDIEAVRFGSRLNVEIECTSAAGAALIPGFLVQPLVENAIKHGVAPSRHPVTVRLKATLERGQLCIIVENDNVPEDDRIKAGGGAGVGLTNVRRRLQAVFGDAASLVAERNDTSYVATICIPSVAARR